MTGQRRNIGKKDANNGSIKYLSNFWRTLEMPLINCEITLMLTWLKDCSLVAGTSANQEPTFTITDTKLYVPVVTLSTQDHVKLFKQLESGFKRTINWNKDQCKGKVQGKITIFKTLAISKAINLALVTNVSHVIIDQLNKIQKDFKNTPK